MCLLLSYKSFSKQFCILNSAFCIYFCQIAEAPQGSTIPVSVTGRPISEEVTLPPNFFLTTAPKMYSITDEVYNFVELCSELLYEDSLMMLINSYTTGLSSSVMEYILGAVIKKKFGGKVSSSEIGLPVTDSGMILPCGASAIWEKE